MFPLEVMLGQHLRVSLGYFLLCFPARAVAHHPRVGYRLRHLVAHDDGATKPICDRVEMCLAR